MGTKASTQKEINNNAIFIDKDAVMVIKSGTEVQTPIIPSKINKISKYRKQTLQMYNRLFCSEMNCIDYGNIAANVRLKNNDDIYIIPLCESHHRINFDSSFKVVGVKTYSFQNKSKK